MPAIRGYDCFVRAWLGLILIACGDRDEPPATQVNPDELTADERARLRTLSPLGALPPDPTNKYADSAPARALGNALFFDRALSGPLAIESDLGKIGDRGRVSCFTCHDGPALDDRGQHLSIGTGRGSRNSPPLVNAAYYTHANWGGRFDSQWSLALVVLEKPEVMNGARVDIVRRIAEHHRAAYVAAFGGATELAAFADTRRFPAGAKPSTKAWDAMASGDRELVDRVFVNAGKSIGAFLRTLTSKDSKFDRFVAGQEDAISASAKRGAKLFLAHCKVCHDGPHFTDNKFHALAVAQFGPEVPKLDGGRADDVAGLVASPFNADSAWSDARRKLVITRPTPGQFRTPTLRNIAETGPYMHAGQLRTLANVVAFYNAGGGEVAGIVKDPLIKPLGLSERDRADLVELMMTFSDQAIATPAPLAD